MSEPIDIIVPWVNPNDPIWRKDFEYWKQKETGNKDACRYRDWGSIKYVLRSIDENCPWCRYVFLVLSGSSQIPDWLNINYPKLKIVYHKDYIPEEYLPTFNSNVIELFFHRIEELSENFILINDDMFFCQKRNADCFFKNDLPVIVNSKIRPLNDGKFGTTLKNSKQISNSLTGLHNSDIYWNSHMPYCYKKSLQSFLMTKFSITHMKTSKFRKTTDLTHFIFMDVQGNSKYRVFSDHKRGEFYMIDGRKRNLNFNFDCICVNEGELTPANILDFYRKQLEQFFHNKSGFEK